MISTTPCPLCHHTATLKFCSFPGYQENTTYNVFNCATCNTSFVNPLSTDPALYDLIYRQAENIDGYARYCHYRDSILNQTDPLSYLSENEDTYWAIEQSLQAPVSDSKPRVLEIGSGFGYLTFALAKRGYAATGLDISDVAVQKARRTFGDLFVCDSVEHFATTNNGIYDYVIISNVVEHIPDIVSFLKAALHTLKPGGRLILTTDNRSFYPRSAIWNTDIPPVHLYWLSETSIRSIAQTLHCQVFFVNFRPYNKKNKQLYQPKRPPFTFQTLSTFDGNGNLMIHPARIPSNLLKRPGPIFRKMAIRILIRFLRFSKRRQTLCAVFQTGA